MQVDAKCPTKQYQKESCGHKKQKQPQRHKKSETKQPPSRIAHRSNKVKRLNSCGQMKNKRTTKITS